MPTPTARTLSVLYEKVGFRFDESELSPALRKRLGEISSMEDLVDRSGLDVDTLTAQRDKNWLWVLAIGMIGAIMLVLTAFSFGYLILGLGLIGVAAVFHDSKVKPVEQALAERRRDLAAIAIGFDGELKKISEEIFRQLSEAHEARMHPKLTHFVVDFARIIQATHGRGLLLEAIQCPNCEGTVSLPKEGESFQCKYCGKPIHAVDVFEKLKTSLNLEP